MRLLVEGHSTKGIAARLRISGKTVATHRGRVLRKLGARSLADVVRYAIRHHIVLP